MHDTKLILRNQHTIMHALMGLLPVGERQHLIVSMEETADHLSAIDLTAYPNLTTDAVKGREA